MTQTFPIIFLMVGQTTCGKTSFVQSLGKNKMFCAEPKSVDWVSKITLKIIEDKIRSCFAYTTIEFHYPDDLDEFDVLLETCRRNKKYIDEQKTNDNCNTFGERKKFDKLIVMDDVSGLADKSHNFSNFLTVCRKFGYICLYIFHII